MKRRREDEGAALLIVVAFVFVLSLVIGAIATNADTSIRSTQAVRDVRSTNYALDAGVAGAIQAIRPDLTQGVAPGYTNGSNMCSNYNAPPTNGMNVTVSCVGEQGVQGQYDSGAFTPTVNGNNIPPVALQTTANNSEPGVYLDANGEFRIHGSVQATSDVRACTNSGFTKCSGGSNGATLTVEGTVVAGNCIGTIKTYGPPYPPGTLDSSLKSCPNGTPSAIPAYLPDFASPPAAVSAVPTCAQATGNLLTMPIGTYTDATKLNALTTGSCANKIIWFPPGKYFFNFSNAGSHEWDLADATDRVVGGTPFGWTADASARVSDIPKANATNPAYHACITDFDAVPRGANPNNLGVQFAFSGDSHLNIQPAGGNFEICAQPSTTSQEIALLGMPVRGNSSTGSLGATSVTSATGFGADIASAGLTIDGSLSTATTTGTASATFAGYNQLGSSTLPDNAAITQVLLRVTHQEGPNSAAVASASIGGTAADGTAVNVPSFAKCAAATPCSDTFDVTSLFNTVARLRGPAGQAPTLSYSVTAAAGKTVTASLDGLALDVSWLPPSLTANNAAANPAAFVTNVSGAQTIGDAGPPATLTLNSNNATTCQSGGAKNVCITLPGYNQWASALPAGAVVTAVDATIVHSETGQIGTVTLGGTAADGTALSAQTISQCATTCTSTVSLLGATSWTASKLLSGTTGPTLRWQVSVANGSGKSGSATLDGIKLDVRYVPDALGSASGCVSQAPYAANDASTCALLRAQGSSAYVSIHGTIYAPADAIDLKVMNGGTTVFGRGVIARTLRLFFNPSVQYTGDNITINVPDVGAGVRQDRIVDFWACPPLPGGSRPANCDDGNAKLHVVAEYADASTPGADVTIKLWARRR